MKKKIILNRQLKVVLDAVNGKNEFEIIHRNREKLSIKNSD